jgi:hypothetical protein
MKIRLLILTLFTVFMISCKKDKAVVEEPAKFGKVTFQFSHKVNGQPLITDTLVYTNAAGNEYMVNDIKYFVSEITLHNTNGSDFLITSSKGIHYVDTDIPSTNIWEVSDDIPVGDYSSVSFVFGINEAKNKNGLFVNPPENNMAWPEPLGGGYHYMQLNGWWKDTSMMLQPFSFHLGIGQIYGINDTTYVQNYFTVTLPNSSLSITDNAITHTGITMNVESWFDTPHLYDFDYWGGSVMQNQAAMHTIAENGADVFTFQVIP